MPAGLIENEDRVGAGGYVCGDLIEMKLHCFGVAERQNEGSAGSMFGADRAEQIGRLGALIMCGARTRAVPDPAISQLVLLANPHLVLEPARSSATRSAKFF